jgi:DNA adenine methylase
MARPVIKWAGGKTQLLPDLLRHVPAGFGRYHEPFIGSAALFFQLEALDRLRGAVLSDANPDLINLYRVVRDAPEALIAALEVHARHASDRDYYYAVRAWDRRADWLARTAIDRAARMIFLNKTCFNGLHRVNRSGQFNVPFGRYERPTVCDTANLRAASQALQPVELLVDDFAGVLRRALPGDLVYFDPPYVPRSATASFTAYTRDAFDAAQHRRLADVFRQLTERGCTVLLSNSATPLVHELYADFRKAEVTARRAINREATKRGLVGELIVQSALAGSHAERIEVLGP